MNQTINRKLIVKVIFKSKRPKMSQFQLQILSTSSPFSNILWTFPERSWRSNQKRNELILKYVLVASPIQEEIHFVYQRLFFFIVFILKCIDLSLSCFITTLLVSAWQQVGRGRECEWGLEREREREADVIHMGCFSLNDWGSCAEITPAFLPSLWR